jgi:hypothetical protein
VKKPRIAFSDAAIADILEQSDWYEAQADRSLAQRWEEAVTDTLLRIAQRPTVGSRCRFTERDRRPVTSFLLWPMGKHFDSEGRQFLGRAGPAQEFDGSAPFVAAKFPSSNYAWQV